MTEFARTRLSANDDSGRGAWDAWWNDAARDPALRDAAVERRSIFAASYPTEEFSPPADWHVEALTAGGFTEAGVAWRSGNGAIVVAVR